MKDRDLTVEVHETTTLESLKAAPGHTGTGKPGPGNVFLGIVATFRNEGAAIELARDEVTLTYGESEHLHPLEWEWQERADPSLADGKPATGAIRIEETATIGMTFEIPLTWKPNVMVLSVSGTDVGRVRLLPEVELVAAARKGDIAAVRRMVASGTSADARRKPREETALMFAAQNGHLEMVRFLLESGADFNALARKVVSVSRNGGNRTLTVRNDWTAMDAAIAGGNAAIAEILRKAGAPATKAEEITLPEVKVRLKKLGYDPGPIDDTWNEGVSAALEKYQMEHHLPTTRELDPATLKSLGLLR
jgi:hypothetical protein